MMLLRHSGYVSACIRGRSYRLLFSDVRLIARWHYTASNQPELPKEKECEKTQQNSNDTVKGPPTSSSTSTSSDTTTTSSTVASTDNAETTKIAVGEDDALTKIKPLRWVQKSYDEQMAEPIIDEKGQFIVSRVDWPTGEIAYITPPPPDGRLAPRFGYNIVQVKKDVSWWKYYQKYPHISVSYINIQVLFLLGTAWLVAFLTDEYRKTTDEMKTPGAMVGEHRGRGPVNRQTQKVEFSRDEMTGLVGMAQNNWLDAKAEANYIGSKNYNMKKIPRPKEFSMEDFRKR